MALLCNPKVDTLPVENHGPCFFSVRTFRTTCDAFVLGRGWRESAGNFLRRLADKTEGVKSLTLVAYAPSGTLGWEDVAAALTDAASAGNRTLNERWRTNIGAGAAVPYPVASPVGMETPVRREN